jgi:nitroreductase
MSDDLDVIENLLVERKSCRGFRGDPVPAALIERLLTIAQRTASWCNSQPWQVVITRGEGTEAFRSALHSYAASGASGTPDFPFPREYRGEYLARRRDSGFRLYAAVGIGRDDAKGKAHQSLENFRLFGAPHVAIITSDEALGPYGAVDCGGYVANFLMAAQAAGLATIPQAALAHHSAFVRQHFGLGDDRRVVCGISFGYADPDHPANAVRTPRAAIADIVRFVD